MTSMLRIGVLSDTHLNKPNDEFKTTVERVFSGVDIVIHAGDMTGVAVHEYLSRWDLKAVAGNMDEMELKTIVPAKRIEELEGRRIGIVHGRGTPFGIEDVVAREFDGVDIIIFGHSHIPMNGRRGRVYMLNPGSYRSSKTVAILELGEEIKFKLMEVR